MISMISWLAKEACHLMSVKYVFLSLLPHPFTLELIFTKLLSMEGSAPKRQKIASEIVRVCAGLVAGAGLAYGNFWMVGVAA